MKFRSWPPGPGSSWWLACKLRTVSLGRPSPSTRTQILWPEKMSRLVAGSLSCLSNALGAARSSALDFPAQCQAQARMPYSLARPINYIDVDGVFALVFVGRQMMDTNDVPIGLASCDHSRPQIDGVACGIAQCGRYIGCTRLSKKRLRIDSWKLIGSHLQSGTDDSQGPVATE